MAARTTTCWRCWPCRSGPTWAAASTAARWSTPRHGAANMDTLISLGSSVAYLYSLAVTVAGSDQPVYFDTAALIVTLIYLGKYLEAAAKGRTGEAITRLAGLQPRTARVVRNGQERDIPIAQVVLGDTLLVRPGERMPVDGTGAGGREQRGRVDAHRREPAGGQGARRRGDRRHGQRHRAAAGARPRAVGRDTRAGRDHPAGGAGPGLQGPGAAAGRPHLRRVRAGGARPGRADLPGLAR